MYIYIYIHILAGDPICHHHVDSRPPQAVSKRASKTMTPMAPRNTYHSRPLYKCLAL